MNKKKLTILMSVLSVVLLAACAVTYLGKDRKGPEIVFNGKSVSYQQGGDTSALLEDVTAVDSRDGDVTESVRIDQITEILSMNYIVVTYVARDNSNNITKQARWIDLTSGTAVDESMIDFEEELEETESWAAEESEETESRETEATEMETEDSETDETAAENTEDSEPLVSTGAPVIRITAHDITLAIGETFDYMNYVQACIDDVDTMEQLYSRIIVNGEDKDGNYVGAGTIDTSRANTYDLQYYVVDTDGNMSNIEKMMVRVGE